MVFLVLNGCKHKSLVESSSTNLKELAASPYHWGADLKLSIQTTNGLELDSFRVSINNRYRSDSVIRLDSTTTQLGYNVVKVVLYSQNDSLVLEESILVLSPIKEQPLNYQIVKTYPHNQELFTQGLLYDKGFILESGGNYGSSKLVKYPLGAITYTIERPLAASVFAEGIARLHQNLLLLTWKERRIFEYDYQTLNLKTEHTLPNFIQEGWGITSIEEQECYVVSDGTSYLYYLDTNLNLIKKQMVLGFDQAYKNLNELEYHKGKIYANLWQDHRIIVINPQTGCVEQYLDLSVLKEEQDQADVLNGITFINEHFLVTGKLWNKLYELSIVNY
jgi:glutaminyl-peptide cyclotransferase